MHLIIANLTSGGLSGGSRKYLERMVPLLNGHSRISRLDVIVPPEFAASLRETTNSKNISPWPDGDERRGFRALSSQLSEAGPHVILIPSTRLLQVSGARTVVMMRNMEPVLIPFWKNPIREALKNVVRRRQSQQACRQADHVIAVSDFVQRYLIEKWKVASNKITRIYHGIEATPTRNEVARPSCLPDFDSAPLLFTAGSIRPARGLEDLIRALETLKAHHAGLQLVVAGEADNGMQAYAARLKRLAERAGVAKQIHWTGSLSRSEMSWCYYNCTAFVMTSRAEACPNVALEAMSHGCACVSVDASPMPELFPSTALYYRSGNAAALAAQLKHCIAVSAAERARWQAAALVRAANFSWQRTAQETVALLNSLVRGREKRAA